MINALPIPFAILAILSDDQDDIDELFRRAIAVEDRRVLLDQINGEQEKELVKWIRSKLLKTRVSSDEWELWRKIYLMFTPRAEWEKMGEEGCPECGHEESQSRLFSITRSRKAHEEEGLECDGCGHVEMKYQLE